MILTLLGILLVCYGASCIDKIGKRPKLSVNLYSYLSEEIMKAALEINLSFDQILSVVKKLPRQQKIKLTKELEKEGIYTKLSRLLRVFKTNELDLATITEEVEIVRQEIYEKQKR